MWGHSSGHPTAWYGLVVAADSANSCCFVNSCHSDHPRSYLTVMNTNQLPSLKHVLLFLRLFSNQVKHCLSVTSDPISGPTPRIRLLIVANRPIVRNTELTLPFDFDFTACRYLVKCACARKGCPVARWFRQTTQTDPGTHNSNLMYSRKLPSGSRGLGNNSRPRAFVSNVQDNYSDILADNFDPDERYGSNAWSDSRLDTDALPPIGLVFRIFTSLFLLNVLYLSLYLCLPVSR